MKTRKGTNILLKKNKIRNCSVKLNRLNVHDDKLFQNALFRMHNIRGFKIILHRMNIDDSTASGPKRKLLANINTTSVRSNVIWIPPNSTNTVKAAKAAKRQVVIPTVNEVAPKKVITPKLNPGKRRRAVSMFVERSAKKIPISMPRNDDFHVEILKKLANLKPASERQLGPRTYIEPMPQWKHIHKEFQQKLAAKLTKADSKN